MDATSLEEFVKDVNGTGHLRVEQDFGDGFVRLQTSEAERRQAAQDIRCSEDIVIELLRNARDARAAHIYLALSREGSKRTITVIDDGCGIPEAMHGLVFEPRVTSKLDTSHMDAWGMHGRGMALFSIAENALSSEVVQSQPDKGCAIRIASDTKALREKADQSSFPTFELSENGQVNVRGPKNIVRVACEFAIEERSSCSVFVGSPAEIAASMYAFGNATLSAIDRVFCKDVTELAMPKRLATSADPANFRELACSMGLEMSERTARRIMDGEIEEAQSLLDRIAIRPPKDRAGKSKARPQRTPVAMPALKLSKADGAQLCAHVKQAYADIAEAYYLEPDVAPPLRVYRDRLVITVPIVQKE